jgi:hypothetical protein
MASHRRNSTIGHRTIGRLRNLVHAGRQLRKPHDYAKVQYRPFDLIYAFELRLERFVRYEF